MKDVDKQDNDNNNLRNEVTYTDGRNSTNSSVSWSNNEVQQLYHHQEQYVSVHDESSSNIVSYPQQAPSIQPAVGTEKTEFYHFDKFRETIINSGRGRDVASKGRRSHKGAMDIGNRKIKNKGYPSHNVHCYFEEEFSSNWPDDPIKGSSRKSDNPIQNLIQEISYSDNDSQFESSYNYDDFIYKDDDFMYNGRDPSLKRRLRKGMRRNVEAIRNQNLVGSVDRQLYNDDEHYDKDIGPNIGKGKGSLILYNKGKGIGNSFSDHTDANQVMVYHTNNLGKIKRLIDMGKSKRKSKDKKSRKVPDELDKSKGIGVGKGKGIGVGKGKGMGMAKGKGMGMAKGKGIGVDKGIGGGKGKGIGVGKGNGVGKGKGKGMRIGRMKGKGKRNRPPSIKDRLCAPIFKITRGPVNQRPRQKPTHRPISQPLQPTRPPTRQPTHQPTHRPTIYPTVGPTDSTPVNFETKRPTVAPSSLPLSLAPIPSPTQGPVPSPTQEPVPPPTQGPFVPPTITPVVPPMIAPVVPPTLAPVPPPTQSPVAPPTQIPVSSPSETPIPPPSQSPLLPLTSSPSSSPTESSSSLPTESPSSQLTESPSSQLTESPSSTPTESSSSPPTESPSFFPTESPSFVPTPVDPVVRLSDYYMSLGTQFATRSPTDAEWDGMLNVTKKHFSDAIEKEYEGNPDIKFVQIDLEKLDTAYQLGFPEPDYDLLMTFKPTIIFSPDSVIPKQKELVDIITESITEAFIKDQIRNQPGTPFESVIRILMRSPIPPELVDKLNP